MEIVGVVPQQIPIDVMKVWTPLTAPHTCEPQSLIEPDPVAGPSGTFGGGIDQTSSPWNAHGHFKQQGKSPLVSGNSSIRNLSSQPNGQPNALSYN